MSTPNFPGAERFIQLYNEGLSFNKMADDPELRRTLLADVDSQRTRSFKCYYKAETLCEMGVLERRKEKRERKPKPAAADPHDVATREDGTPGFRSAFEEALDKYEAWIGAPSKTTSSADVPEDLSGRREWICISDLHIPDVRHDLVQHVIRTHAGGDIVIVGDLNDYESWGRWPNDKFTPDSLRQVFAEQDALLELLDRNFRSKRLMLGNHDRRPWQKAGRTLGPDYGWLTHEFMMRALTQRQGIHVVDHRLEKLNGRHIEDLHFYHQIGDCLLSHAECSGGTPAAGAVRAHDFFNMWDRVLGLEPWNVLVHAHTHKQSWTRHKLSGRHLFECGAMCDIPEYALKGKHSYGPTQHGYFILVQHDGVTDLNESRLVCLD